MFKLVGQSLYFWYILHTMKRVEQGKRKQIDRLAVEESYRRAQYLLLALVGLSVLLVIFLDMRMEGWNIVIWHRLGTAGAMLIAFIVGFAGRKRFSHVQKYIVYLIQQLIVSAVCIYLNALALQYLPYNDMSMFIIGMLGLSVAMINDFYRRMIIFIGSSLVMIIVLFHFKSGIIGLTSNLANIILVTMISFILSTLMYRYYSSHQTSKMIIADQAEKLTYANDRLQKLDTMKNDFIANLIHDFRSPLSGIVMLSDLRRKYSKDRQFQNDFELILDSAYRMKRSIDRLLDLSKLDSHVVVSEESAVALVPFLKNVIDYYQAMVQKTGILLSFQPDIPEDTVFITDKEKLDQILCNLLSNAVKFVDRNSGRIRLHVREEGSGEAACLHLVVEDNGIGIPADKLTKVFNRFEQLTIDRAGEQTGSGIGLTFCRQLTDILGGRIWAESEGAGQGSAFHLILPVKEGAVRSSGQADNLDRSDNIGERKALEYHLRKNDGNVRVVEEIRAESGLLILIIDDEPSLSGLMKDYLKQHGYRNFILTNSGKAGLNAARKRKPDIILCDYQIPDLRGDDLLAGIKSDPSLKNVPVVFVTASGNESVQQKLFAGGAADFLKKPIDEDELIESVEYHLCKSSDQSLR